MVRAAGLERGRGPGAGRAAVLGQPCWRGAAGGATRPLFNCKDVKKAINQRLSENLAAAPGRAVPVPRCWASLGSVNYPLVVLNQENAEKGLDGL